MSCPAGLHYNPSIEKCDWPENAQCSDSQQNGECHHWICNVYNACQKLTSLNLYMSSSGDGDAPQVAPILVEVAEDFDCTTEGVFQDPDDCSR